MTTIMLGWLMQSMSVQEQWVRAFLTLKAAFGGPAAFDMWERTAAAASDLALAEDGTEPPVELELADVQLAFMAAWEVAGAVASTPKARVAAKKAPAKVRALTPDCGFMDLSQHVM